MPEQVSKRALRIPEWCQMYGASRATAYRLLASGDLQAVKSGRSTLILAESAEARLARLPPATFRQSNAA